MRRYCAQAALQPAPPPLRSLTVNQKVAPSPGVLSTPGNLNNLVGMPLTLLRLSAAHRHAVLEMGMNAPGEIARLAATARPEVGLVTNVHPVHLLGLGTIQAVAEAKGELVAALEPGGVAVLNADDPYVLKQGERTSARRVTFGQSPAADVRVAEVRQEADALTFQLNLDGRAWPVRLPRLGAHNALNAAAAAAVGWVEGVGAEPIVERLARAALPPMRMQRLDLGDAHLLVDCYNANPRSVQAALATLAEVARGKPRLAVLGDMLELGESAEQLHRQVGRAAAEVRLDGLCAFGPLARFIAEGAREAGLAIDRVIALIDREEENGREKIAAHVARVEAVLTRTEIMSRYRGKKIGSIKTVRE